MLLYERGNVDLIVFFLWAMIVLSTDYSPFVTAALLIFATIVKLFPFFGVTVLFREAKSKFISLSLVCLGVLAVYVYATFKSVQASWELTMRGNEISYGADILFLRYGQYFSTLFGVSVTSPLLKYGPIIVAFVLVTVAGIIGIARHETLASLSERNLAAFRIGASIYIGTFLLGNNWDYRLAFLILITPQVSQWSRGAERRYSFVARAVLFFVLVSCWHFMVWFSPSLVGIRELLFVLDEIVNWMLLVGLSYLLFASMPDWVKEQFGFLLPKIKPAQVV